MKKLILASQIALKRTQNNERQLEKALRQFFKSLRGEVLDKLNEYWSEYQLLQGQINLMTQPITDLKMSIIRYLKDISTVNLNSEQEKQND